MIKSLILAALLLLPSGAFAAESAKFNFRATSGYVTDGVGEIYVLGETSPQTRGGYTFQWNTCGDCARDRSTSVQAKFAGVNKRNNDGTQNTFTFTMLETGPHDIRASFGDATGAGSPTYAYFYDDATLIASVEITPNSTSANTYLDATGVLRTEAAWDGANVALTHNFASTTFRLRIGSPTAQSGETRVTHLAVESSGGGGGAADDILLFEDY